eukprot:TRINITY_DN6440_c0_g1_i1.p1 TRINITY_DN6440_c0_g1~~TRINITY_DN6440_c0_g1_i1.p1  ORF type:complete len:448 (+),score=83.22 TRINITY_DN6440_c0_g1_i1:93-1436(+)
MARTATAPVMVVDTFIERSSKPTDINKLLSKTDPSLGEVFTVMRQWQPDTQQRIIELIDKAFEIGGGVNDRDSLSGNTMLHFACKAGASGLNAEDAACQAIKLLLAKGATINVKNKWTDMTPLHCAAFFGFARGIELLCEGNRRINLASQCNEFEGATPLHLATLATDYASVKALLVAGADKSLRDNHGRTALDLAELMAGSDADEITIENCRSIAELLRGWAGTSPSRRLKVTRSALNETKYTSRSEASSLEVGDKVSIANNRRGVVKYLGTVHFASGTYAGVQLDDPLGKHNGTVDGQTYFTCKQYYGVMVPVHQVKILSKSLGNVTSPVMKRTLRVPSARRKAKSPTRAPVSSPVKEPRSYIHPKMQLGDKIMYHNGLAELKFVGTTEFAPGVWLGVEFEDDGHGKHDGTVKGVQYFRTHHHGRGLFIKPEKATCHGIPCSELI